MDCKCVNDESKKVRFQERNILKNRKRPRRGKKIKSVEIVTRNKNHALKERFDYFSPTYIPI